LKAPAPPPDLLVELPVPRWGAAAFADALLAWFDRHGRKDLPWQRPATAYRVWVSEIMLQQTRVSVVIPYFERFIARFPGVASLAAAEQDAVLALWSGLGYYARARNLHRAAQIMVERHGGQLPTLLDELTALPGIGRSTAGAIRSLAHGEREPILDGNCKRVLARCFAQPGWPGRTEVQASLWGLAEQLTPTERVRDFNQAMMDLGATLCTRSTPDCPRCPLASRCVALQRGAPTSFPEPKPKRDKPQRRTRLLVVVTPDGRVLLEQRPPAGIWGGLWIPPEIDDDADRPASAEAATHWCRSRLGTEAIRVEILPSRRHSFTHFQLDIQPVLALLAAEPARVADSAASTWIEPARRGDLGLPAPISRLLDEVAAKRRDTDPNKPTYDNGESQ
jgi:A/G-specific adenine glycosylase